MPFKKTNRIRLSLETDIDKYKLVDYRQQNYTVIDFSYSDLDSVKTSYGFFHYMNNNNLSTYVPIPTTDKSEFTFVFNNTLLAKYDEKDGCGLCYDPNVVFISRHRAAPHTGGK